MAETNTISVGELISNIEKYLHIDVPFPDILQNVKVDAQKFSLTSPPTPPLAISCDCDGYGTFVLVGSKGDKGSWEVAIGLEAELKATVPFPHIPLLSEAITPLGVSKLGVIATGATVPSADALKMGAIFGDDLKAGISLHAVLQIGSHTVDKTILLKAAPSPGEDDNNAKKGIPEAVRTMGWLKSPELNIPQDFGPIHIEKVGLGIRDSTRISISPDVSVRLAPLEVDLEGLSVSVPLLNPTQLSLHLDGLALSFSSSAVSIGGEFLHQSCNLGDTYEGGAFIRAESFQLSGLGAYFKPTQGNPSIFLDLILDAELGGPPFFYVEGLAGGFGYNYDLMLPNIDGVKDFPFVAQATGANYFGSARQPADVLARLNDVVKPKVGEDWLAAGVKFSTFKLLDSFALLTGKLGTNFEAALLGLSTLSIPPKEPVPIAQAQLAIDADYSQSSGLLKVEGKLTPASFLFSKACKLTGGFAFYMWFSGEHAGDFVITLGGYHPRFQKPSHYPGEPKLGYSWQIGSDLHLEGGLYFALTPMAVMAGGKLSASYQSGGLRAWFDESADFLLSWKPFHYTADLSLGIGVSYTIKVWFVKTTITVHLGVGVVLSGPPFGGVARFKAGPFHVKIKFGDTDGSHPLAIPWSEFRSSFLPENNGNQGSGDIVQARFVAGKVKDPSKDYAGYIVDPASLELKLSTAIPIKRVSFNGGALPGAQSWSTDFGVASCAVPSAHFESNVNITVQYSADRGGSKSACTGFTLTPVLSRSPQSLWGPPRFAGDASLLSTGALIENTLTGFTLAPSNTPKGNHSGPYPVKTLLGSYDPALDEVTFAWETVARPTADQFDQNSAVQELTSTINNPQVSQARASILQALIEQGLPVSNTKPDVSRIAQRAADVLLAAPVLSLLGEERG